MTAACWGRLVNLVRGHVGEAPTNFVGSMQVSYFSSFWNLSPRLIVCSVSNLEETNITYVSNLCLRPNSLFLGNKYGENIHLITIFLYFLIFLDYTGTTYLIIKAD